MIGRVTQSYVRNCSVHDTFNRAVAVHGVFNLEVSNNVAYNNMGHAFFIEVTTRVPRILCRLKFPPCLSSSFLLLSIVLLS